MRKGFIATSVSALLLAVPVSIAHAEEEPPSEGGLIEVTIGVDGATPQDDLAGAFVSVVVAAGQEPIEFDGSVFTPGAVIAGGVTDARGILDLELPPGDYSAVAATPGFQPDVVDLSIPSDSSAPVEARVSLPDNERPLSYVNAFGAQVTSVVTDGEPGVFYATTNSIPSFYRTTDYGGSWAPVVLSSDVQDSATGGSTEFLGLDGSSVVRDITTSGYPGEVAVLLNSQDMSQNPPRQVLTIWYSRDFGTSWQSKVLTGVNSVRDIQWAHAYDAAADTHSSYLFIQQGSEQSPSTTMNALVMPTDASGTAADPEGRPVVQMVTLTGAASYLQSPSDLFSVKPGGDRVWIAVQRGDAGTAVNGLDVGVTDPMGLASDAGVGYLFEYPYFTRTVQTASGNFFDNSSDLLLFGGPAHPSLGVPMSLVIYNRTGERNSSRGVLKGLQISPEFSDGRPSVTADDMAYYDPLMQQLTPRTSFGDPAFMQSNCGENETTPVGSTAPVFAGDTRVYEWAGFGAMGMFRQCMFVISATGGSVPVREGGSSPEPTPPTPTEVASGTILVIPANGANNNTGSAFSAGFDLGADSVVLSGDGARGVVKAATFYAATELPQDQGGRNMKAITEQYNYSPTFPATSHVAMNYIMNRADAGTEPTSGGFAIKGITSPTVRDIEPSPVDPAGMLMGFSFTGGGRTLISANGGDTWATIGGGGSNAVAWWTDADGDQWLAGGSSGDSANSFMSARRITPSVWETYAAAVAAGADPDAPDFPNDERITFSQPIQNFGANTLGVGGGELGGLVGITGTDRVLVGARSSQGSGLALARLTQVAEASGDVTLQGALYLRAVPERIGGFEWDTTADGPAIAGQEVVGMQYCPAEGLGYEVAPAVADTAFVAFASSNQPGGGGQPGGGTPAATGTLLKITGLSTQEPTVTLGDEDYVPYKDVKVDCASGAVLLGVQNQQPESGPGLRMAVPESPGGDLTEFAGIAVMAPEGDPLPMGSNNVEAVAVDVTGDRVQIVVAAGTGDVIAVESNIADFGGFITLEGVVVNDTSDPAGFTFGGEKPGDIEFPTAENEVYLDSAGVRARASTRAEDPSAPLLGAGAGAMETTVSTEPVATVPDSPRSLGVTGRLASTKTAAIATVTWQAPLSNGGSEILSYAIRYRVRGATSWTTIANISPGLRTRAVSGLRTATTYEFEMAAVNAVGPSGWADMDNDPVMPAGLPGAVTELSGKAAAKISTKQTTSITLTWRAAAANGAAVRYEVHVKSGTTWKPLGTTTRTTYTPTPKYKIGSQVFKVTPRNSVGAGTAAQTTVKVLKK